MVKPENPGSQGADAKNKANKGQDENIHTFINAVTGETRDATQREFRSTLRDQGFAEQEDPAEVEPTPEVPA